MSITVNRAGRHIKEWSKKLAQFSTRANWPPHLFHTCQLEVAVEIIKSGAIICRNNLGALICDVANQGAVWNNPDAHKYVRLYFRPRNPFHLKTEGIKSLSDPYRVDPHMSIPISFAFDFQKVITLQNVGFVPGNFARSGAAPLTGDAEFDHLNF
jgi:ssDNA thymidine ADP-ribosyltransferase, DarT